MGYIKTFNEFINEKKISESINPQIRSRIAIELKKAGFEVGEDYYFSAGEWIANDLETAQGMADAVAGKYRVAIYDKRKTRDGSVPMMIIESELILNESKLRVSPLSASLMAEFDKFIMKLHLYEWDDYLELNMIRLHTNVKNQGIGTKIMERIIDYADNSDKTIHLTPTDEFGSNKKGLIEFYKRFGFVSNRGDNQDFKVKDTMIRYPRNGKN